MEKTIVTKINKRNRLNKLVKSPWQRGLSATLTTHFLFDPFLPYVKKKFFFGSQFDMTFCTEINSKFDINYVLYEISMNLSSRKR